MATQKVQIQLLDETTGAVISDVTPITTPESVSFSDGKNLTQKLNEISLTPGPKGDTGATGATGSQGVRGEQGIQGAKGDRGAKGDVGAPFQVKKIYASVAAMNAGFASDTVLVGEFVLIDTGNVQDADNAKLFCKTDTKYSFITDLSGAQGIQGPQGAKGDTGSQGIQGTQGVQGAKGNTGEKGEKGDTVKVGASIATATQRSLFFKVV